MTSAFRAKASMKFRPLMLWRGKAELSFQILPLKETGNWRVKPVIPMEIKDEERDVNVRQLRRGVEQSQPRGKYFVK